MKMGGVKEYYEGMDVHLIKTEEEGRYVVKAFNEAGHNATEVDLIQLIEWLREYKPECLNIKR